MMLHEDIFVYLRYKTNKLKFLAELAEYTTPCGHVLSPSENARDLGVYLSADYTWIYQIGELVSFMGSRSV